MRDSEQHLRPGRAAGLAVRGWRGGVRAARIAVDGGVEHGLAGQRGGGGASLLLGGRGWPLGQRWIVHHLFYAHKPWAPWARCGPYFDFLSQPGVDLDERTTCAAILAEKRRCLARNIGASLPPAQCEACGRGEVQAHMRDDESRAQLHWACKQTTQCHQDHDREWIEWAVI